MTFDEWYEREGQHMDEAGCSPGVVARAAFFVAMHEARKSHEGRIGFSAKERVTRGPWKAHSYVGQWCAIHSEDGLFKNIALVPAGEPEARLIAAAPELLEAVDRLLTWNHGGQRAEDVAFARQAYAKALGHDG